MKLVYDRKFALSTYATDNASLEGRMEAAMSRVWGEGWEILAPTPADEAQLLRSHDAVYIGRVKGDKELFEMASLAAGGAILSADLAMEGEAAFACVRPPGHHASRADAWGWCCFNNLAVALLDLRDRGLVRNVFVIDIDQHTGDGTRNILASWEGAEVFNPYAETAPEYLKVVEKRLLELSKADVIAVSAGFDAYRLDQGKKLDTADFGQIGRLLRKAALRLCGGRRFAVLEGGYYLPDLGANVLAFCREFA